MLPTCTVLAAVALVVLTAMALLLVRSAAAPARWLALLATVAFGVVVGLAPRTERRVVAPCVQVAEVSEPGVAARTAMLVAAAGSGPRAEELRLAWRVADLAYRVSSEPAPRVPVGVLGAAVQIPPALPFAPEQVRLRTVTELRVDRPATMEVAVTSFEGSLPAEVAIVGPDGRELLRETIELGAQPATASFLPSQSGRHEMTLSVAVTLGGDGQQHQVRASGTFEVALSDEVLCIEPSGVVAAALMAQGVRVRSLAAWPDDWSRHRQLVLGLALTAKQQAELVDGVEDGLGLFVLPDAFGQPGAPLRALLPVAPRAVPPAAAGQGDGGQGSGGEREGDPAKDREAGRDAPDQPPSRPDQPNQPEVPLPEDPPSGQAEQLGPISKDPVEVDKHAIAMVLLVDGSTSMNRMHGNFRKLHYAQESARRTAASLDVGDRVGIVSFGTLRAARVELPMTDATRADEIAQGIQRLSAYADSTWLLHGMQTARSLLQKEGAAVKHVVVITDGMFYMRQTMGLRKEAHDMRTRDKITVSIISILDAVTEAGYKQKAQQIVTDGGGRFIASERVDQVPRMVSSEVQNALSRVGRTPRKSDGPGRSDAPPAKDPSAESPEPPERNPPEVDPPEQPKPSPGEEPAQRRLPVHAVAQSRLLSPDPDTWPTLGEAVPNDARLDARVLLAVGDEGWPLLSFANRGLGRVAAFCAPLAGAAGREFREHPAFPGWLAQWLAATSAAEDALEPKDVREQGGVDPRAPLPDEVLWLARVSGAQPGRGGERAGSEESPAVTIGREPLSQVARAAPGLLLVLLLLAIGERVTSWFTLRRGQG